MKPRRASLSRRGQDIVRFLTLASILLTSCFLPLGCHRGSGSGRGQGNAFVMALSDTIRTIDPIGSTSVDASSERVRTLMFNSLVKKDDKFDYVPELASNIQRSGDGLTYTLLFTTV